MAEPPPPPPDVERRALDLIERLANWPERPKFRERLLRGETAAVLARVEALEAASRRAPAFLPTEVADGMVAEPLPPPLRIGPFRVEDKIGEGGMGAVYRGQRDDGLYDQTVAIKLIHGHLAAPAGAAFESERRILAKLEHPNIARLIDGGVTDEGRPYLIMEYVAGAPIDEATAALPLRRRIDLFLDAAEAVQFAHSRWVAHADIKPGNILVDTQGRVRLLDFGIARLVEEQDPAPSSPTPLTWGFASPARLDGAAPSISDDVYALGQTLAIVVGELGDADLKAVIARARAPDEARRYGSVAAFVADLHRWREHLPVAAHADTMLYRARKFTARHKAGVSATVAALLILSLTSITATLNYRRAEHQRAETAARFDQVRSLAKYQLFDLYDQLRNAPGTVALRAQIAQRSAVYLDQLRHATNAPATLKLETATSYRRLASVQGLSGTASLGRPDQAKRSLALAEQLAREVLLTDRHNLDAMDLLGWIYADRWTLMSNSGESPRMNQIARGWFDAVLKTDPRRSDALLGRLVTEKNRGYDLAVDDKPREALTLLSNALTSLHATAFAKDDRGAARALESIILNKAGDAAYSLEDIPSAVTFYRAQRTLVDAELRTHGETPEWLSRRGEVMFDLGGALSDVPGREQEGLVDVESGIVAVRRVLDFGPDANAEKKLVMLYGQEAVGLAQTGRMTEAIAASAESLAIREKRLAGAPDDPARMRDIAIAASAHAQLLDLAHRRAAACAASDRAVGMWSAIRARGELGARDAAKNAPRAGVLQTRLCRR